MKRIFTLILALSLLALTAASGGGTGETDSLTPEERTQRFVTAITDAPQRGGQRIQQHPQLRG